MEEEECENKGYTVTLQGCVLGGCRPQTSPAPACFMLCESTSSVIFYSEA